MTKVMRASAHVGVRDPLSSCGVQSAVLCTLFYLAEQLRGKQRLPLDNRGASRPCYFFFLPSYSLLLWYRVKLTAPKGEWSRDVVANVALLS